MTQHDDLDHDDEPQQPALVPVAYTIELGLDGAYTRKPRVAANGAVYDPDAALKSARLAAAQLAASQNRGTDPIFRTTGQALFFAFWMEVVPLGTKSPTAIVVEDLMERRHGSSTVPISERTINLGSMTPLELRGQCAMIRTSVGRLPDPERDVIFARFGYQTTRAAGVRGLRDHFGSRCATRNQEALLALLWAVYAPRAKGRASEWSLRTIEREYGVNKSTLHRDQQLLRSTCHLLEMRAQEHMDAVFVAAGLIPDPATAS